MVAAGEGVVMTQELVEDLDRVRFEGLGVVGGEPQPLAQVDRAVAKTGVAAGGGVIGPAIELEGLAGLTGLALDAREPRRARPR